MKKKRSSNILITGFPNVGKSSLINFLLKRKISIVSSKVQTTNENIQAVLNHNDCQMIFVDTPGIINKKKFYSKKLSREIFKNTEQIDINLFVYDVTKKLTTLKLKKINETISTFKKNLIIPASDPKQPLKALLEKGYLRLLRNILFTFHLFFVC